MMLRPILQHGAAELVAVEQAHLDQQVAQQRGTGIRYGVAGPLVATYETTTGGTATYENYVGITDDSQAIYVEVPAEWAEVDGSNWVDDEDGTVLGSELLAGLEGGGLGSGHAGSSTCRPCSAVTKSVIVG